MMRAQRSWPVLLALAVFLPAPALAQSATKTRPVDVLVKPAAPEEPRNRIEANYEYEHFTQGDLSDWHWFSVEYHHRFDWGTLIPRVNWARRFDQSAFQYEIDAYPRLTQHTYLYLNAGVAEESFFPKRRYGADIFWSLPKAFEASAGARRLEFDGKNVNILTGSVGYYHGNYYFAARPWISSKPGDTSVSLSLMMRRYYATRHDYWTVRVGGGQGSDSDQTIDQLITNNHAGATFEWQKLLHKVWIVKAKGGFEWYDFETGTTREGWLAGAGLARLF